MSLTEQKIKENTKPVTFRKGKAIYLDGGVGELLIDRDEEQGIVYINGTVEGQSVSEYQVSVDLDEFRNYEPTAYHCECEAYRNYPGFCKHLVAVQLAFIQKETEKVSKAVREKKDMEIFDKKLTKREHAPHLVTDFSEFREEMEKAQRRSRMQKEQEEREQAEKQQQDSKEEQLRTLLGMGMVKKGVSAPKPRTNLTITRMLDRLAQSVQEQVYENPAHREQMELEPQLYRLNGYGPWAVSFRVGAKKKYVIKSVEEFVRRMDKREYFSYGKQLSFVHSREHFAKESLPLLDFILEYVHLSGEGRRRSFYYQPSTKEIVLNASVFAKLMEAIQAGAETDKAAAGSQSRMIAIPGGSGGSNRGKHYLCLSNPEFTVSLEKVDQGAYLKFPKLDVMPGSTRMYLVEEPMIYRCSEEFTRDLRILFEQLSAGGEQELFIADQDLQSVCASIMPLLQKHLTVREEKIAIEEYQPPQVEFYFYLDDDKEIGVTCRVECKYGPEWYRIFQETDHHVYRDLAKENMVTQVLERYFSKARRRTSDFMITEEENLYQLLQEGISELNELGQVFATEAFKRNGIRETPSVDLGVSIKSDLLDLSISSQQLPYEELDAILSSYKLRKRYHRLKDGQFLELEDSSLSVLSELADGLELRGKDLRKGKVRLPKHRALFIDAVLRDGGEQVHVHRDHLFKGLIRNIKNVEDSDYEVPAQQAGILRSYQKKGYRWLRTIREYGFGGILADDMGLGKTLQVITLFQAIKEEWQQKPSAENTTLALVVCPASLVYNWESEIKKFAPDLQVQIISGASAERKSIISAGTGADIWITSYDLLKRDMDSYEQRHFDVHVIDEAQYIKNASTQAAKAVKSISSNTRIALTGTPIENRLSELWSIFDFLMPGLLFSYKHFKEEMETAIMNQVNQEDGGDQKALTRLKNMVRPFILRRLKEDVLKDLPKKLENVVYAKMEGEQRKLYDARVQNLKQKLEGQSNEEFKTNKIEILSELTRLRQLCCDPGLCYEDYKGNAAKLELCMEMVLDAVSSGHKLLLFSQFTTMLERIAQELQRANIDFYMLTGETKKERRVEMAKAFNENQVPVFLISLRAGGTGLNLVGADMVIHFDPWWNLAAQNQATDRAHRIGQKRVVTVFKMIAAGSIEEKILALQEKKKNLSDQIISDEGMSEARLTREDLLEILS